MSTGFMRTPSTIPPVVAERHPREPLPGVAVVNSNYQYVSINETMAAFHGRSIQDHLGRHIIEVIQPSVHQLLLPVYRHVITTGIAVENIVVQAFAGTRLKRCTVNYYSVGIGNDPLWGVQVVAIDVTPPTSEELLLPQTSQNLNEPHNRQSKHPALSPNVIPKAVKIAIQLIEERYFDPNLSLTKISRVVNVSERHLVECFTRIGL